MVEHGDGEPVTEQQVQAARASLTPRERALLDIAGRATLAASEAAAATLGLLAFLLDDEAPQVLSPGDVERMLEQAGTVDGDGKGPPATFGAKRRALTTEQPTSKERKS